MEQQQKIDLFRERFYGRQDVYGKQWVVQKEDGTQVRGYAPVCGNLWKEFCHLRLKDGVQCIKCEHRRWAPVTDDSVLRHIQGEEAHIYYVLQTDATIKFGAMDFDMKPGKEEKGYSFQEVKGVSDLLKEYGVPHYIARSTGAGYHLYVFFEDSCPAYKFRSFIVEIYERVGFMQYLRQGLKPIPEHFPKQSYAGRDGIGNGIKPPMIEPQIELGKNCWVDENDKVIEDQWDYFKNMKCLTAAEFDKILEERQIPVDASEAPSHSEALGGSQGYRPSDYSGKKWQHPITGSIEKVMEGCKAFRKIRDKALGGAVLGHGEGFALYHMCMHTQDGLSWFKANTKGWGENDKDLRQLEHSMDKNYLPWTCKKLQEQGVCAAGTQCFEKKPPREIIDGMEVIRDDIPKDRWPDPSPIRYAFGRGEDYLERLKKEVISLKSEAVDKRPELLKELARRIQVFDEGQQKEFKEFVREQKPLKRNELSKIFNEASDIYEEEVKKQIESRDDAVVFDDHYYMKAKPAGYLFIKTIKDGKKKEIKLCSVDIIIKEERVYQDDVIVIEGKAIPKTVYTGTVKAPGIERSFEIPVNCWVDNSTFLATFTALLGYHFSPLRSNIEYIRQASLAFSRREGIERTVYMTTQGYYGDTYLTPSCVIDATGVRPNTTQRVDLSGKGTRSIDFTLLPENEFHGTLLHIKTTLMTTWPALWVYTGIAQTLAAGVITPLDWHKRVTLFYEGLTGGGKSELTQSLQYFWGNFPSLANFFSTSKGVMELGYQFKDACLVVDDYKGLSREQTSIVKNTIQRTYDGSFDFKCEVTTALREPKGSRCLYIMSGEEFVTHDAAVISRTILVETNKQDTRATEDKLLEVQKFRPLYRGITPRFLAFYLRHNQADIQKRMSDIKAKLKEGYYYAQNIDRISQNLALNYTVFTLFTEFLVENNAASAGEKDSLDIRHYCHMTTLRNRMVERCAAEQSSEVFLRVLSQMIVSGEVRVSGVPSASSERKIHVGFIPKEAPNMVCLFPKVVFETVKNFSKNAPILGTEAAILRQLEDQGALASRDAQHLTKNMRYDGKQVRVICVKATSLGFLDTSSSGSQQDSNTDNIIEFRPAKKEDFGIM